MQNHSQRTTAVIIGAGMAGIKATADLHASNVDAILLEAQDQIGGRLLTDRHGKNEKPVDLGACWFHDTLMNPLFDLVLENNLPIYYDDSEHYLYTKNGLITPMTKIQRVEEELEHYIESQYFTDLNKHETTLHEMSNEYIEYRRKILTDEQIKYAPQALRMLENWHGLSWDKISAKYAITGRSTGRNAFVKCGYDSVISIVKKPIFQKSIHLNSIVTKISNDTKNNEIKVTTNNGFTYIADYAIIAIPLSVLKLKPPEIGAIEFNPPLPKSVLNSINLMSFGALGKVFLEFDTVFWPEIERWTCLAENEDQLDDKYIIDPFTRNSSDDLTLPSSWTYPLFFVNNYLIQGTPSLIVVSQEPLTQIFESNPEKSWEYILPMLSIVCSTSEDKIPKPTRLITSKWTTNPFSRGSFSACKIGDDPFIAVDRLQTGEGNIRFAGEHTVNEGNGCTHGAWESGKREAAFIIEDLRSQQRL